MKITVVSGEVEGSLSTPCSKSYAQRAFAAALLAEGRSTIRGLELCDDTRSAIEAITALGAKVEWIDENTCTIEGG
ncbi:MAG: 3-phosphoshikimate 1-carboxyvinyltransferase, partial [Tidjanibacter sp.]|nr:3-phosphoshikimate 1-carboxyvinyltransferase [Tidjanibacter sp.]